MPGINSIRTGFNKGVTLAKKVLPYVRRQATAFPKAPFKTYLHTSHDIRAAKAVFWRKIGFTKTANRLDDVVKRSAERLESETVKYSLRKAIGGAFRYTVDFAYMAVDAVVLPFKIIGAGFRAIKKVPEMVKKTPQMLKDLPKTVKSWFHKAPQATSESVLLTA